ncbi:unnamed protein product [Linum tenue]|uniref:Cellulose synthase-like protein G3 n=1 Tax=Linum tenue TaxID=586396 RepID=A0AAV0JFT5_9ROSI|nr:unnamed protein product [Linum tenue]
MNLQNMYESMKHKVEHVVETGKVDDQYIDGPKEQEAFGKWTHHHFTKQNHPTFIQVLLDGNNDKDVDGHALPNLIYVSREKSTNSPHHFKAGALNVLIGYRYGSLVEDYYTGYRLHCEGWKSVFCCPKRAAFMGDAPISLVDMLNQQKRWDIGLLEVAFSKFSTLTYGVKSSAGFLMGFGYCQFAFWPSWSIPLIVYSFLPQLALLNQVHVFPKATEAWFWLYPFLFLGAYVQDMLDFTIVGGTFQRWWSDQRIWLLRGLTCHLFGSIEYFLKFLGIAAAFNVTSKVIDEEQSKRYDQGIFEFGVHSPMFVPPTVAALISLLALVQGLAVLAVRGGGLADAPLLQLLVAGFGVVNGWPIYEAVALRSDNGRMPVKTVVVSVALAWACYVAASFVFK